MSFYRIGRATLLKPCIYARISSMRIKKVWNIILIIILISINVTVWVGAHAFETNPVSNRENRMTVFFPIFSFKTFLDRTFQDTFENAVIDQVPESSKIKEEWNTIKLGLQHLTYRTLDSFSQEENLYIPKGKDLYEIASSGHIIPLLFKNERVETLRHRCEIYLENILNIPLESRPDFYFYYIEGVYDVIFMKKYTSDDCVSHVLFEHLTDVFSKVGKTSSLRLERVEDYQDYYYRTDHHVNHKGQARVYRDCIRLLFGDEELLLKSEPVLIEKTRLVGSRNRQLDEYSKSEEFIVNDYELPEQKILTLGLGEANQERYGNVKDYIAGNFNDDIEINHYGACFGYDSGLITIETVPHRNDRETLLIIGDSFSNPVNLPIAAHFNTTYVVDIRYYKLHTGHDFSLSSFVTDNKIDKVLFIGNAGIYLQDEYGLEQEATNRSEVQP